MLGHGVYPEKAQVGRVSVLTKRQVSFDAITLSLSSKQYATCSLFFFPPDFLVVKVEVGSGGDSLVRC